MSDVNLALKNHTYSHAASQLENKSHKHQNHEI